MNVEPVRPGRSLCTDCGVSRTDQPKRCAVACQFVRPDYRSMEAQVHGRARDLSGGDERFFGPYQAMWRARLRAPTQGAQWTGITTRLAEKLLEDNHGQAILTVAGDPNDRWRPVPKLIRHSADLAQCRGMRMGYAPLLSLLEPARAQGIKRLGIIGVPCQIYALRALEAELGFEKLYVIGTPCSDNTETEKFHEFLALLVDEPDTVTYCEFRADYHVELRFSNGSTRLIPFLSLPLSQLPPDFFPLTCRTCVDYTNVLADITVGYMAGEGDQWVVVRNNQGQQMLDLLGDEVSTSPLRSMGARTRSVRGFIQNVSRAAGGMPVRRMPSWLRPLVAWLMPRVGPRGLEFARARVEMKAAESIIHLRREMPKRVKNLVPVHVWNIAQPYGFVPGAGEQPTQTPIKPRSKAPAR